MTAYVELPRMKFSCLSWPSIPGVGTEKRLEASYMMETKCLKEIHHNQSEQFTLHPNDSYLQNVLQLLQDSMNLLFKEPGKLFLLCEKAKEAYPLHP